MQEEAPDNFSENPKTQEDVAPTIADMEDSNLSKKTLMEWTASEYIKHHKPANWYLALVAVVVALSGLVFLVTRDVVSAVTIGIVGVLFGVFASREPEVRTYKLTPRGITISEKLYPFELFKSYAVYEEEAIKSIFLLPMKRFMPGMTLYFPPEQEEDILGTLSSYLPFDDREPDIIDRFMNKIRF